MTTGERGSRSRLWTIDVGLAVVAVLSQFPFVLWAEPWIVVLGMIAAASLLARRALPVPVVVATLPVMFWGGEPVPAMIAIASLAVYRRRWAIPVASASAIGYLFSIDAFSYPEFLVNAVLYAGIYVLAPMLVGMLVRTRRDLAVKVEELTRFREHDRRRAAEVALARERTNLAREMHDSVSHQVTLIAIHAGALEVSATDVPVQESARTIRSLASVTMDELRAMVDVLRRSGGEDRDAAPQPSAATLRALLEEVGADVRGSIDPPPDLGAAGEWAVYRFVQEGLTNARKHSAGAPVTIASSTTGALFTVSLLAGPATEEPLRLPSSRHGLVGLRERAILLGGTFEAVLHDDGGHEITMTIPIGAAAV